MSTGRIRLLFDATVLENSLTNKMLRTGVYFAAFNIIQEILRRGDLEVLFFTHKKELLNHYLNEHLVEFKGVSIIDDPRKIHGQVDAYFSAWYPLCGWLRRYFPSASCYSVLYDIIGIVHPEHLLGMKLPAMWGILNEFGINDHYFAISECSKRDILRMGKNIDPEDITVIPLAANEHFFRNTDVGALEAARKKYNIPADKNYILSLCSLEPRKNLINSVDAFIEFIEKNDINNLVYVLAGNVWPRFREEMGRYVAGLGRHSDKIITTGYVDDQDVSALYSNALWFVYTSRYEGFGLPPLEAMQCGCPVVTSNNSSLPEVVGDAGIMVDSLDIGQHVAAYEAYYFNPRLREENSRKGRERARQFSWRRCADIICDKMVADAERKKSRPKVSLVVAANFDAASGDAAKIDRCLDSLAAQDYANKEVLVLDCGADAGISERLGALAAKAGATVRVEPGGDASRAYGAALPHLGGEYAAFLDPDVFYPDRDYLAVCMAKSAEHHADLAYADSRPATGGAEDERPADIERIPFGDPFCRGGAFFKLSALGESGGFSGRYGAAAVDELVMRWKRDQRRLVHVQAVSAASETGDRPRVAAEEDYARAFFDVFGARVGLSRGEFADLYSGDYAKKYPDAKVLEVAGKLPPDLGGWGLCRTLVEDRHLVELLDGRAREAAANGRHWLFGRIPVTSEYLGDSLRSVTTYRLFGIPVLKIIRRGPVQAFYYLFNVLPVFATRNKT